MPTFEAPPVNTAPTKGPPGAGPRLTRGRDREPGRCRTQGPGRLGQAARRGAGGLGALDERGLVEALADFFGVPVTDWLDSPEPRHWRSCRQTSPARTAIPSASKMTGARGHGPAKRRAAVPVVRRQRTSVRLSVAPMTDIRWAVDRSYQALDSVGKPSRPSKGRDTRKRPVVEPRPAPSQRQCARRAGRRQHPDPGCPRDRASDVHIEPSQDVIYVRFRIDGALKECWSSPAPWASG